LGITRKIQIFRSPRFGRREIAAPAATPLQVSRGTDAIYTHVISEDAKRVVAQLGDAAWGISAANGRENEKGSEVAAPNPSLIC
jgi:hypothetical protein